MLFTRCPDCDTTFRVTDEALQKAHGQVRCGRCASVFNAYSELRDPQTGAELKPVERRPPPPQPSPPSPPLPATPPAASAQSAAPASATPLSSSAPAPSPEPSPTPPLTPPPGSAAAPQTAAGTPTPAAGPKTASREKNKERFETFSVADVVAQVGLVADEDADTGEMLPDAAALAAKPISAERVHEVLDTQSSNAGAPWLLDVAQPRQSSRWWSVAALLAIAVLGAQAVHHFRADLIGTTVVGPIVRQAYALLGATVLPHWDVRQYEILDWVATAEPNARGQGSLRITAHIQNHGPQPQPYPSVKLRLKDRWEKAVRSRMFAPTEYLDATAPAERLMTPGETTRAQIEVVDPGPDAYGFELDVCIEVETGVISCGTDKVFL